jgi:hypothetical protein
MFKKYIFLAKCLGRNDLGANQGPRPDVRRRPQRQQAVHQGRRNGSELHRKEGPVYFFVGTFSFFVTKPAKLFRHVYSSQP